MRSLRWGMSGDDVRALQQRLKDLGYLSGAVDGWFGYQTAAAVRRYQQAAGLVVDGVAGPDTLRSLGLAGTTTQTTPGTTPTTPAGSGARRAVSLHLGLNAVDPAGYGGWAGQLSGCEADADTMTAIAASEGFATNQLKTARATATNVLAAIGQIATRLEAGDIFLLTYAGHGSQMPNGNSDPEVDSQDETWCLYDRQLLDDEIEAALAAFRAGVNIVLLSDSCHSGTIYRLAAPQPPPEAVAVERGYAGLKESFYLDLGAQRPGPSDPAFTGFPRPVPRLAGAASAAGQRALPQEPITLNLDEGDTSVVQIGPTAGGGGDGLVTRAMPFGVMAQLWRDQGQQYQQLRQAVANRGAVQANGVSISGCMDNQLSQEVNGAGVFTTTVNRVWASNSFTASYEAFHKAVVSQMGPTQTPELGLFGVNPQQLLAMVPFNR
jgi:metacaspase-1